ncbi:MAG: MBL fold metallo-hydrolase [Prevotellaceae bacterium]|jgi:phosphoribosyl 1,2-cyclic phosphodiesterase|nr:MBL fold metallo-hydrolase [Prevotellaceae bacterium]
MKLKVLGSGSAGNCYILDNGKEALVIEAGIRFAEVKEAVGFDISRIAGCLVSHEHNDHARYVQNFFDARIPVYMTGGTAKALGVKSASGLRCCRSLSMGSVGGFGFIPFGVQHDAAEPAGFLIKHEETGNVLFATDTYYLRYCFVGLSNILIECNYSHEILDKNTQDGSVSEAQRKRTTKSHMSYKTCRETLLANDLQAVNNIVLIHLSDGNSSAEEFKQGIRQATGKTVHIAEKGLNINFNKTPF